MYIMYIINEMHYLQYAHYQRGMLSKTKCIHAIPDQFIDAIE